MKKNEFLGLLDELLELSPGTIRADDRLDALNGWDSLAVMGFIAMVDERFEMPLSPKRLAQCKTVGDLMLLLDGRLTD